MITTSDQLNRQIILPEYPRRIISLVPSQTELLFSFGLNDEVIGITKFCIHPDQWFQSKVRVGGTKKINIDRIRSLQPDLIIANKEENTKEDIDLLSREFPVWISDIKHLDDALKMIRETGRILNREKIAIKIANDISMQFESHKAQNHKRMTCLYLIWKNPYMAAGADTFISDILMRSGFDNVLSDTNRYPVISLNQIKSLHPDVIFLSSEPFPFKQKEADELKVEISGVKVYCVDGEMFSWYGSRLLKSCNYIDSLRNAIIKNN